MTAGHPQHDLPAPSEPGVTALSASHRPPAVWGGVECSVVRVGDDWRDQVLETGHYARGVSDIDLLADLGVSAVRYPVLWENTRGGWQWHDQQLGALQRRNIAVVAGLIHHGSGPAGSNLLDPAFPEKLALHAGLAAERYPTMRAWTVVNEPQTTARFSCLYGYWYPHCRNTDAFLRAVANQCRAVLLASRAIRAHCPGAKFIQTEDVGRVFSTSPLRAQARYENARRWLSLDLLCGRIDRTHPWRGILEAAGVPAADLEELATGEAAPDLIGVNHYATSDRFLDHRTVLYPPHLHGGNGDLSYVDTEAVRANLGSNLTGWEPRLREVWQRYRRPMVLSEVHLGCDDPAESVRWLMEAWTAARRIRADGIPVEAVTAWALFGLIDWDCMLRERRGRFEAGALDDRQGSPNATLLATAIASLASNGDFSDPCLGEPGWWRRSDRVHARLRA